MKTLRKPPDGSVQEDNTTAGTAVWADAAQHSVQSLGDGRVEAIYVELK
jgi:hypothetical protein